MCNPLIAGIAALALYAAGPRGIDAQDSVSTRAGRRPLLPREVEVALARSAAPPGVSAAARVLVLTDTGHVVAAEGTNGMTCVVNRSWRHSLEPHCYDAEGSATVLPMELERLRLRHGGATEAEVDRAIADGVASGRFRAPRRPAVTYMMSSEQVLYNDNGRRVGAWRPHVMIYFPYLTNAEVGLGAQPDMSVGMVSAGGSPASNLTIIVPGFAPRARGAGSPAQR